MSTHDRNDLAIHAIPIAEMRLAMAAPLRVDGPAGTRIIVEFTEVEWTGERIVAHRKGPAADWLTIGPDQTGCLDVRFALETQDGALIYVHGIGRNHAAEFLEGSANYFSFVFETGDARYAWLNRICAIAKGRLQPDNSVAFRVYELR